MRTLCKVTLSRTAPSDPRLLLLLAEWQWHLSNGTWYWNRSKPQRSLPVRAIPAHTPSSSSAFLCVPQFGSSFMPSTLKSPSRGTAVPGAALQAHIPCSELSLQPQAASPHIPQLQHEQSTTLTHPKPAQGVPVCH